MVGERARAGSADSSDSRDSGAGGATRTVPSRPLRRSTQPAPAAAGSSRATRRRSSASASRPRAGRSLPDRPALASRPAWRSGGSSPGASPSERILPPSNGLPSPAETFASFPSLWFDRALTRNLLTTLRRVALGLRAGHARGRAAGRALRLLLADQRLLPAADPLRPQHPGGRPDPADLLALRHRRAAEGDVHLHRLRGVHRLRHGPGDRRGAASRTSTRPTRSGPAAGRRSSRCWCRWRCPASSTRCGCCSGWPSATSCWPRSSSRRRDGRAWATSSTRRSGAGPASTSSSCS